MYLDLDELETLVDVGFGFLNCIRGANLMGLVVGGGCTWLAGANNEGGNQGPE